MKKLYNLTALLFATLSLAQAGAPAMPYYSGIDFNSLTGTALKTALVNKITTKHTHYLSYSQVWDAIQNTDVDPANNDNVLLLYGWESGSDANVTNDHSRDKYDHGGNVGQWNREHTFAQSLGDPDLGTSGPGSDAHHLRASDVQRNGNRGNLKFADGSGIESGASNSGWYPGDEWKGDVARMVMYMYLHYGSQCLPTFAGIGATIDTDSNLPLIFLEWNAEDPVSAYEDNRNTYLGNTANTYAQGNRNPFIDNPYLATLIWGGPTAENRWPSLATGDFTWTQSVAVYPNPSHGRVNISSSISPDAIEVISVNGQLIKSIDHPVFESQEFAIDGLPKGFYLLRLSSNGQSIVQKVIIN